MIAPAVKKTLLVVAVLVAAVLIFTFSTRSPAIDFNTEVKPIINKKCISCHGGVKRQGGFSLLFRSEALANTESGKPAIVPGDPDNSEMIRRLTLHDLEERMPYHEEPLTEGEIKILRNWVKQGAVWGDHWAYVPVKETPVPASGNTAARNAIDHFIYEKQADAGLKPSPEADKATLLRRLSLDLIGMQAPEEWAQTYLKSSAANAYDQLVDSLLASRHFGEKWASVWLDIARYADTKGYERDSPRNIWRYRDWLIRAFNEDKSYDKFLKEQIAGDLLPHPTDDQLIATAFHRNTLTNDEGGTDNEEFRTAAVLDRVNTTWEGIMGTTFACVQCHSHPYDPFTHDEYYKFLAFFNDTRDEDTYEEYPLLRHFTDSMSSELTTLIDWAAKYGSPAEAQNWERFIKTWEPSIHSLTADELVNSALADTKWLNCRNHGVARLKSVELTNRTELLMRYSTGINDGILTLHIDSSNGPVVKKITLPATKGWEIRRFEIPATNGVHHLYLNYSSASLTNPEASGATFDWFHFSAPFPGKGQPGYAAQEARWWGLLNKGVPTTPIMMDNPADMHRPTQVFERGNWLVKGKEVKADVPHALNRFPDKAPRNRLGLAMWLTQTDNPLTARTMVNRVWEQFFGAGLAETLEDLGTQGVSPTHRELLDYLAYQFMHTDKWSLKKLMRSVVLSATYRQDSKATKELIEKDPYNKYYARGARVRLSAEQVRDQSLCISGLISTKMFGPPVYPYQPDGIWLSPYNGAQWKNAPGEDGHRRAVYTYWKRTAPYPSMITFDGAPRELCAARRIRTNTPLQALVTMNDEAYLDMARHMAYRMQQLEATDVQKQISKGYELAMYKAITPARLQALSALYQKALKQFSQDKAKTCAMIGVMDEHNNPETAALVVTANAMLNLDELITKN
ncbi:DUF1553 domain-containing protein [Paraflavitalea sp. CAU 1676]|uniref:DUF1553 domain-containing protein n=1 Tax=Paraflavitalea sp. CAU 1676 TaxID=3032598 RepID=UPI0023DB6051|nr:DUF1553 domain-containing protein [Paraflavitalea sp. CAU 1676]MDF2187292.1 DUF1553 domain-containing protein [Paraflavitalea sp. CAU 1676]